MRLDQVQLSSIGAVFWVFLFYVFIFQPPVFPKLAYLVLQVFFVVMLMVFSFRRVNSFVSAFKVELVLVLFVVFYAFFRDSVSGEIVYADRFLGWCFQGFIVSGVLISFYFSRRGEFINSEYFAQEIYLSVVIASVFTFILFFVPSFDSFYESIQLDGYYERYSSFEYRYRAYGIAENLTFTYSFVLGLCAGYSLILSRRSWLYLFFVPLFIFGVSVNARVGFLGFVLFVFYIVARGGVIAKLLVFISFLVIAAWLSFFSNNFLQENAWALGFFLDISNFLVYGFSGDNIFATLVNDHFVIPSSLLDLLFGSGKSIYVGAEQASDVGYILQLNYGGFLLLVLLFFLVLFMSMRLFKVLGFRHWYSWFFPVSILLLNFKGFIFAMTPGGRFLVLLYIFFIFRELMMKRRQFVAGCLYQPLAVDQPHPSTDSAKVNNV
ncbi:hypothetical protein LO767_04830 [Halopseudomonas aestusnigri]|uniref:hypothetical protein n=1 Tax=Halopseudomonas aestusnigri TaxID=857252 RepID=UPI001E4CC755|nr:hypothetical protein [Halopseudomonas aestusnigri]UGV31817.1 hypothetical protein LO767_04830 [Halopseudomonas aestusnigri]